MHPYISLQIKYNGAEQWCPVKGGTYVAVFQRCPLIKVLL